MQAPAHESKSWTAEAPAETWTARYAAAMPAILSISAAHTSGAPNIIALVRACSFDGPPSTRYDATVNGAPAKPISGVPPSSPTSRRTDSVMNGTCSGVRSGIAATSASVRTGEATTGPTPGLMSRSTPTALRGSTMSEKKMAASTPYRRTGCRVISTTRSGVMQDSSMPTPWRRARYSGSERPACRMNHTGVCGTGSPRAAFRNALWESSAGGFVTAGSSQVSRRVRTSGLDARPTVGSMVVRQETHPGTGADSSPPEFRAAVATMRAARLRPEVFCEEMPAPQRIAPYAAALTADVTVDGTDLGTGRIILLHDPAGNDAWDGTYRCVAYARAEIELDLVTDPMLAAVGWSWLTEALDAHGAAYTAASGTVTRVATESFGGMADEGGTAQLELRASWTPIQVDGPDGRGRRPARRGLGRAALHGRGPGAGPRGRDRHPEPARATRPRPLTSP